MDSPLAIALAVPLSGLNYLSECCLRGKYHLPGTFLRKCLEFYFSTYGLHDLDSSNPASTTEVLLIFVQTFVTSMYRHFISM